MSREREASQSNASPAGGDGAGARDPDRRRTKTVHIQVRLDFGIRSTKIVYRALGGRTAEPGGLLSPEGRDHGGYQAIQAVVVCHPQIVEI